MSKKSRNPVDLATEKQLEVAEEQKENGAINSNDPLPLVNRDSSNPEENKARGSIHLKPDFVNWLTMEEDFADDELDFQKAKDDINQGEILPEMYRKPINIFDYFAGGFQTQTGV